MKHRIVRWEDLDQPGSFAGPVNFKRNAKLTSGLKSVKEKLTKSPTYTLHNPARKLFRRRLVYIRRMHEQYCMDLKDIQKFAGSNYKKRYLLVVIDGYSKQAWIEAIPNKTGAVVTKALDRIFSRSGVVPSTLQIDEGKEFLNKDLKPYLKRKGIRLFWTRSPLKSVIIERFIRTLFEKIQRYMTHYNTRRFVDVLPKFEKSYNSSYHRSIKRAPFQVTLENQHEVYKRLYPDEYVDYKPPKYKIGTTVVLARKKKTFDKGYTTNYMDTVYKIAKVRHTNPRVYMLETMKGEPIFRSFYEQQIVQVNHK